MNSPKQPAVFPGKFNPPHIGHARTALKLAEDFDLTVVVTRDTPDGAKYTPEEIAAEFRGLGLQAEVFDGVLTAAKTNPFGRAYVISGNMMVYDWTRKVGARGLYHPRSGVISGTRIRE